MGKFNNDNSGAMFPRPKKSDSSPDMGGVVYVGTECEENKHWCSVWGAIGDETLSISLNPMGSDGFDDAMEAELETNSSRHPKAPKYKGELENGTEIAIWVRKCGPNTKTPNVEFLSMKLTPSTVGSQHPDNQRPQNDREDFDDDIPF